MTNHSKISPTAVMTAHLRTYSDIPYASELFSEIGSSDYQNDLPEKVAPELEARYKLIDKLLKNIGVNNVLEMAAGYSSRGMDLTRNPEVSYVEFDLPEVIGQKRDIVEKIVGHRPNLRFCAGTSQSNTDVDLAAGMLSEGPITVINEGLMRYLTLYEKKTYASLVRKLLLQRGGVWITPDITLQSTLATQNKFKPGVIDKVSKQTGTSIDKNAFSSVEEGVQFFETLGFISEVHPFTEVTETLTSPPRFDFNKKTVSDALGKNVVVVFRAF